jgi:ATP-dependent DNA ligase
MSNDNEGLGWPFQAMTFKTGKREMLETYLDDPDYCYEQKLDGTRCMILWDSSGNGPRIVQRNGVPLKHAASVIHVPKIFKALGNLPRGWRVILDGELMWDTGRYVMFDLPSLTAPLMPAITPQSPFGVRRRALEGIHGHLFEDTSVIRLVRHAREAEDKHLLAQSIKDLNGEGVLIKDLRAPYGIGTRVSHSLKVKFTKTVDVIVLAVDQGRNEAGNLSGSISFGLMHEPVPGFDATIGLAWTGSCSAIGRGDVKPGDVIEVEYLAYMAGGGIREPRMVRVRTDKIPSECTMGQFTEHSRAVL